MQTQVAPTDREPHAPNHPLQEQIVVALLALQLACRRWQRHHDEAADCDRGCDFCRDADALLYQAEIFESVLDGQLLSFPAGRAGKLRLQRFLEEADGDTSEADPPAVALVPPMVTSGRKPYWLPS